MSGEDPLIGCAHCGAFICEGWELRITARCLRDDLDAKPDAEFAEVAGHDIVAAFTTERRSKTTGTDQVNPIDCGKEIWVLRRGHDHRGATWYDEDRQVIWLLAYRRHRSGQVDDSFPYFRELATEKNFLPTQDDFSRLRAERNNRLVERIRIEAPMLLAQAYETGQEARGVLAGTFGTALAVEVEQDLQAITIAIDVSCLPPQEKAASRLTSIICNAVKAGDWDFAYEMPSRELDGEVAFCWHGDVVP